MHSLRKRTKLDSSFLELPAENNQASVTDNTIKYLSCESECALFSKIPIEIVYSILEKLPVRDLMRLRLMNKNLHDFIDKTSTFWHRVSIEINIESGNLSEFMEFLRQNEKLQNINMIKLDCSNKISKKLLSSPQEIQTKLDGLPLGKDLTVFIKTLNSLTIAVLNYFNFCTCLIVDKFVDSIGQVKSLKNSSYFEFELNRFNNLRILDMNCKICDSSSGEVFKWININVQNKMINKMDKVFWNLNELYISFYAGSLKKLIKCVKSLVNLKVFELENPSLNDWEKNDLRVENKNVELQLETLIFQSVNIEQVYFLLNSLSSNLINLAKLDIFVSELDLKNDSQMIYNYKLFNRGLVNRSILKSIILLISSLGKLKIFSTNLAQIIIKQDLEILFSSKHYDEISLVRFLNRKYSHRKVNRSLEDFQGISQWKNLDLDSLINIITNVGGIKNFRIDLYYIENNQQTRSELTGFLEKLTIHEKKFDNFYLNVYFSNFKETNDRRLDAYLKKMNNNKIIFKMYEIKIPVRKESIPFNQNTGNIPLILID